MTKKTKELISIFIIGVVVFFLGAIICQAAEKEIRLGFSAPLTGSNAEMGVAMKQGEKMIIEEWNAKGGIYLKKYGKKLPIKFFIDDDQSRPEVAVSVGEKMITRHKVHAHVVSAHSSLCMAVMELAPKYKIPIIGFQTISGEIAKKVTKNPARYNYFWKTGYNHYAYGTGCFEVYKSLIEKGLFKPKNKSIAFVVEDTDWGRSIAKSASDLFKTIGFKNVAIEAIPRGYTDFYPQLSKFKALDIDIMVSVIVDVSSGVALAKQFHEVGLKSAHFAVFYPNRPEYIPGAGKAANYLVWVPLLVDTKVPRQKAYEEKIKNRWGKRVTMNSDHLFADDGLGILLEAIERAGSLEPDAIIEGIKKTDRQGLMGRYIFDMKNHTVRDGKGYLELPVAQIQNGKSGTIWPDDKATFSYQNPPWLKN